MVGVDLDVPMLKASNALGIYRRNGLERAAKSFVRFAMFDRAEKRCLSTFLERIGGRPFHPPTSRLIVSDAAAPEFWKSHPGPYDLIFSSDVVEHIPECDLKQVVERMHASLQSSGIAVITPKVFTGIMGAHLVELYGYKGGNLPGGVPAWDTCGSARFRLILI